MVRSEESQVLALSHSFFTWSLHLDQERAIVDHCGSQVFRGDTADDDAQCDVMCRPIVLYDSWIVDREIRRTLIKIEYTIATCLHQRGHQLIGFSPLPFGYVQSRIVEQPGRTWP